MKPTPSHDDLLAAFELPADLLTSTFEHAISDDADTSHEHGHAVAAALQKQLKGSVVEYGYPGIVKVRLASGAIAHCGGPDIGWLIDVQQGDDEAEVLDIMVSDDERDPVKIADVLTKALKGR